MDKVIVWTGSQFDEWDYHKVRMLGIPDYAREATQEEAALYRQYAAALAAMQARVSELEREAAELAAPCQIDGCRYPNAQARIAVLTEKVAAFMIRHSFATGHGDTLDDLLAELDSQLTERDTNAQARNAALDEAAKVAEHYEPRCDMCPRGVAAAILALKERGNG